MLQYTVFKMGSRGRYLQKESQKIDLRSWTWVFQICQFGGSYEEAKRRGIFRVHHEIVIDTCIEIFLSQSNLFAQFWRNWTCVW